MSMCELKIKVQPRGDLATVVVVAEDSRLTENAKPPSRVESGRPWLGASTQACLPQGQEHLPPISASPRNSEGPPHLTHLPTPVLPSERPATSLQFKEHCGYFLLLLFFYFINIIYKDWSSKKAEMRRLGRGGSWLHSCPLGMGLGDPPHLSLLLHLPRNPNPVEPATHREIGPGGTGSHK